MWSVRYRIEGVKAYRSQRFRTLREARRQGKRLREFTNVTDIEITYVRG